MSTATVALGDSLYTVGEWATEQESVAALDEILAQHAHLWTVYREVTGRPIQLRAEQEECTALRIDRILVPRPALIERGWTHGAIGIEAKRSGIKVGPALSQMMDYTRTAWFLPPSGVHVLLAWCFLWPSDKAAGTVASIMANQRIGSACTSDFTQLHLAAGESNILRITRHGEVIVGRCNVGRKVGSR